MWKRAVVVVSGNISVFAWQDSGNHTNPIGIAQGYTHSGRLVARGIIFFSVSRKYFSIMITFFPLHRKMCVSSHTPSRKRQIMGSQVRPQWRVLGMGLACCHPSGA